MLFCFQEFLLPQLLRDFLPFLYPFQLFSFSLPTPGFLFFFVFCPFTFLPQALLASVTTTTSSLPHSLPSVGLPCRRI